MHPMSCPGCLGSATARHVISRDSPEDGDKAPRRLESLQGVSGISAILSSAMAAVAKVGEAGKRAG